MSDLAKIVREVAEAAFIDEESVAANPALLDSLGKTDLAIVIDPIDGTANFVAGIPLFATMASVVALGETVADILFHRRSGAHPVAPAGRGAAARSQKSLVRTAAT